MTAAGGYVPLAIAFRDADGPAEAMHDEMALGHLAIEFTPRQPELLGYVTKLVKAVTEWRRCRLGLQGTGITKGALGRLAVGIRI